MMIPGVTRPEQARILAALVRVTGLSAEAITAAFVDADRGRAAVLDPHRAARQEAYRATNGETHGRPAPRPSGIDIAAQIAHSHDLSPTAAGILVGAAVGLRLALEARLSRSRAPRRTARRPPAGRSAPAVNLDALTRWRRKARR